MSVLFYPTCTSKSSAFKYRNFTPLPFSFLLLLLFCVKIRKIPDTNFQPSIRVKYKENCKIIIIITPLYTFCFATSEEMFLVWTLHEQSKHTRMTAFLYYPTFKNIMILRLLSFNFNIVLRKSTCL